ncbi:hypothetical protein JCM17960_22830 [Magnetospira thiophila]
MRLFLLLVGILTLFPVLFSGAWAAPSAWESNANWQVCARQTAARERQDGVPEHLLTAISLVESGRSRDNGTATTAWPWTINAAGKGYFLPSKAAAIAKVRALREEGIESIDVGCMQVNLMYHSEAFKSLEEAFDPAANVAYAAKFLGQLKDRSQSWVEAAGDYHSARWQRGTPYRTKVLETWNDLHGGEQGVTETVMALPTPTPTPTPTPKIIPAPAEIDVARMDQLNKAFRAKRLAEKPLKGAEKRGEQLDLWRHMRDQQPFTVLAAMQMARNQQQLRGTLARLTPEQKAQAYEQRRIAQLAKWRAGKGLE